MKKHTWYLLAFAFIMCLCISSFAETAENEKDVSLPLTLYRFLPTNMEPKLKENQYSFMHDGFSLYIATLVDDNTMSIECWQRSDRSASGDTFKYSHDVLSIKISGNERFMWLDDDHCAFATIMKDEENYYWKSTEYVCFSVESPKESQLQYTYMHDKWHVYRAFYLTDSIIKIEGWRRSDAGKSGDPFKHNSDVMVINIEKGIGLKHDLTWLDDTRNAFAITMIDGDNEEWKSKSVAWFSVIPTADSSVYTYTAKGDIYRAYPISPTAIKIEYWESYHSGDDDYPYRQVNDVFVASSVFPKYEYTWDNDDHTSFTVMNSTFVLDPAETINLISDGSAISSDSKKESVTDLFQEMKHEEYLMENGLLLPEGTYVVGKNIDPGLYLVTSIDPDGYARILTFSSKDELTAYTSMETTENLVQYGKLMALAEQGETCQIAVDAGDFVYVSGGNTYFVPVQQGIISKGIYNIGTIVKPGSYILELNDVDYSATVATFANKEDFMAYASWSSANNLGRYAKMVFNAHEGKPFHISLKEGEYLYISDGYGTIREEEPGELIAGIYVIGEDIKAGTYKFILTEMYEDSLVAVFANTSDLSAYLSWDSQTNLEQYSKLALYAKDDDAFSLTLHEGDVLFIKRGKGEYTPFENGPLGKGIYIIGEDILSGQYVCTLMNTSSTAVVATFDSFDQLKPYALYKSISNLEQYSKTHINAQSNEPFDLYLSKGMVLYIEKGDLLLESVSDESAGKSDFTFRNGIRFGDHIDEVKEKEPNATRGSYDDPDTLRCENVTLSGISDSAIFFLFENDRLTHIALAYPAENYEVSCENYAVINEGLIRKYGEPIADIENAPVYPGGQRDAFYRSSNSDVTDKEIINVNQWEIEQPNDKKLVIEHILYSYQYRTQTNYLHRVSFRYLDMKTKPSDIIDKDL